MNTRLTTSVGSGLTLALLAGLLSAAPAAALAPTSLPAVATTTADAAVIPAGAKIDDFLGSTLDPSWEIYSPSGSAVSVSDGALKINSLAGDTWQSDNTAKNIVLVDVPNGDFTAVTSFTAPATLDYQGAGIIAWKDIDNYVRAGLAHVGFTTASPHNLSNPIVVESAVESAAAYSTTSFVSRPDSTTETLQLKRVGNTITTSIWSGTAWELAATTEVSFTVTQVGLYALAAQNGTTHAAAFDYFAITSAGGEDIVPAGTFTLRGPGDARYLTTTDAVLGLATTRPTSTLALTATDAGDGVVTLASGDTPVVLTTDGKLAMGAEGTTPARLRLGDAGGGKVHLSLADATTDSYFGLVDGALVLGAVDAAVKLTIESVSLTDGDSLTIDGGATSIDASQELYGIFYEDINYAADGGLYAELVRNRSFEFNSSDKAGFTGLTAWEKLTRDSGAGSTSAVVNDDARLNNLNRFYLKLDATGAGAGIRNIGYNSGIAVKQGEKYDFSVWARSSVAQSLTVRVENAANTATFAEGTVDVDGSDEWKQYTVTVTATATTDAGRLAVLAGAASTLRLDMISLFPQDTWVGAVNGKSTLRKDLAEKTAALNPKFLRFPGGCVTNAGTFKSYEESGYVDRKRTYQWKETLGPIESRPTNWNFWGYNQSYGIGYLEYFEFAEDMGAFPLPVVSVGANGCGSTIPELTDAAGIARWVQDTVDLVEFAVGGTDTTWGKIRADLGHPEPFDMPYIGLGNEENTTTFEANFPKFRDAIKAKFPEIKIISNSGPDSSGARFDTLWQFNIDQGVDLVDEHYYRDPAWFLANTERYDSYDRNGPKVFLGEYASKGNSLWNALSEAAYMTALERNSDVVKLASYAPLLSNEDNVQWSPDAIWFDNDESWVTPNYYVQELFSANQGDQVVPSTHAGEVVTPAPLTGGVFLSTWSTKVAYDNLKVTSNAGGVLFEDTFSDASKWSSVTGSWAVTGGEYVQSSTTVTDARSIITGAYAKDWSNYTVELDARKVSGSEGFLVGFAGTGANNYFWWNLGGWGNTRSVLQKADGTSAVEVKAVENKSIVTGQTYRIKIVVEGRTIKLYLDGALQMEYTDTLATQNVFQVVTRDVDTGDIVAKVVNTSDETRRTAISVSNVGIASTGTVTEISGLPTDKNSKAAPATVVPVERELTGLSGDFTYDFAPYSVTFLRMHTIDVTAPVIDVVDVDATPVRGWYGEPVTVTASASDDRGVATLETKTDDGEWIASADTAQVAVTVAGHGTHTVQVRATDAAGNVSEIRPTTVSIDTAAPVSKATVNVAARTVTLRAADTDAGMDRIEYRLDDSGAWVTYTSSITIGADATTVQFRGVDGVGNIEDVRSVDVPKAGVALKSSAVAAAVSSGVVYGKAATVRVSVAGVSGVPTGVVRVMSGSRLLGSGTLSGGRVNVVLPKTLAVGSTSLTVTYLGDAAFAGSSGSVKVTVVKASSTTGVKLSASKVKTTVNAQAAVTVKSGAGVSVAGPVSVTITKKVSGVTKTVWTKATKVSSTGVVSVKLPKLSAGSYTVRVAYAGSSTVKASSVATTLTVTK